MGDGARLWRAARGGGGVIGLLKKHRYLRAHDLKDNYDFVIIGGGAHGMATAYYLAKEFGAKRVAVIEKDYIGAGASGRNTTIIRANYRTPRACASTASRCACTRRCRRTSTSTCSSRSTAT